MQKYMIDCCWTLKIPLGKLGRRHGINITDISSQIKGKQQTLLFSNGESLIYSLPRTQDAFQTIDIM